MQGDILRRGKSLHHGRVGVKGVEEGVEERDMFTRIESNSWLPKVGKYPDRFNDNTSISTSHSIHDSVIWQCK